MRKRKKIEYDFCKYDFEEIVFLCIMVFIFILPMFFQEHKCKRKNNDRSYNNCTRNKLKKGDK